MNGILFALALLTTSDDGTVLIAWDCDGYPKVGCIDGGSG